MCRRVFLRVTQSQCELNNLSDISIRQYRLLLKADHAGSRRRQENRGNLNGLRLVDLRFKPSVSNVCKVIPTGSVNRVSTLGSPA